jgi:hypothetical protein
VPPLTEWRIVAVVSGVVTVTVGVIVDPTHGALGPTKEIPGTDLVKIESITPDRIPRLFWA